MLAWYRAAIFDTDESCLQGRAGCPEVPGSWWMKPGLFRQPPSKLSVRLLPH